MTKKALLVGINYPGTSHALNGCVNDVRSMNSILTKHYGFTNPKNTRMLVDASATTKNILSRLEWLVNGAKAGDVLYFHYSGHGSQMVDTDYDKQDEPDGLDEIICPIDLNWRDKVIKDDDFKRIFSKLPNKVNLTVVLDCCHSGTGIRGGLKNPFLEQCSPNKDRVLPMPADIESRGNGLELEPKPRKLQKEVGLLISGCKSNQTSADAWIHNKYMGACTYYLIDTLQRNKYKTTYSYLVSALNRKMIKYKYSQRPELNGPKELFNHGFLQPIA